MLALPPTLWPVLRGFWRVCSVYLSGTGRGDCRALPRSRSQGPCSLEASVLEEKRKATGLSTALPDQFAWILSSLSLGHSFFHFCSPLHQLWCHLMPQPCAPLCSILWETSNDSLLQETTTRPRLPIGGIWAWWEETFQYTDAQFFSFNCSSVNWASIFF